MNEYQKIAVAALGRGDRSLAEGEVIAAMNATFTSFFGEKPPKKMVGSWTHWVRGWSVDTLQGLVGRKFRIHEIVDTEISHCPFMDREISNGLAHRLWMVLRIAELRNRFPQSLEELFRLGGITVPEAEEGGIAEWELSDTRLSVSERNSLADRNGWCQYYHNPEIPFVWRGILVHVGSCPRRQEETWSHDRVFVTPEGVTMWVTEARHPYNHSLDEGEWAQLLQYLSSGGMEAMERRQALREEEKKRPLHRLNALLEEDSNLLQQEEYSLAIESKWQEKESSRRSTRVRRKELRRYLRR